VKLNRYGMQNANYLVRNSSPPFLRNLAAVDTVAGIEVGRVPHAGASGVSVEPLDDIALLVGLGVEGDMAVASGLCYNNAGLVGGEVAFAGVGGVIADDRGTFSAGLRSVLADEVQDKSTVQLTSARRGNIESNCATGTTLELVGFRLRESSAESRSGSREKSSKSSKSNELHCDEFLGGIRIT